MSGLDHKVPPPIVGALVALAMWLVASAEPSSIVGPALRHAITGALVAAGVAFDLLGLVAFRASRTTVNPLRPERASALVTGGVYRITRNPMYVGLALLLVAWAVHLGSALPFVGPIAFVAYITRFQILPEERVLAQRFGAAFDAYRGRVRRWL